MTTPDAARSRIMRAVKSTDTKPELIVRRLLHSMGYRFRLHRADLPGKPDIILARWRTVIFVNGCFWHGHDCLRGSRRPATNADYWCAKIARNVARDAEVQVRLGYLGWCPHTIWECQLRERDRVGLVSRIEAMLADSDAEARVR